MKKHAYLILAHSDIKQLITLLKFIDNPYNDIFIHLDKKWKISDSANLPKAVKKSTVYLVKRVRVSWGGYSIIQAEMNLLNEAVKQGDYYYYHLLSGVDLPVKSQRYIHEYFEKRNGEIFLESVDYTDTNQCKLRYEQYHLLQDFLIGRKRNIWKYIDFLSCYIQRFLGVKRFKNETIVAAWQWFSIPKDCAVYLTQETQRILKKWRFTYCADELFIPTELCEAGFKKRFSNKGSLRYIDWHWQAKRDFAPRYLTTEDLEKLDNSDILFARKFSKEISGNLIQLLKKKCEVEDD